MFGTMTAFCRLLGDVPCMLKRLRTAMGQNRRAVTIAWKKLTETSLEASGLG